MNPLRTPFASRPGLVALAMAVSAMSVAAAAAPAPNPPSCDRVRLAALSMQRKSWEQGVLGQAFLEEGNAALVTQMAWASLIYTSKDGVPAALDGAPVDPLMAGETVWRAAELSRDPALRKAADAMLAYALQGAARATDGTVYHTGRTIWSDTLHTSPPLLAMAGKYDEAVAQLQGCWRRLWDPRRKLLAHIWNEEKQQFDDASAWGGGEGWAAAALARVIRSLPPECAVQKENLSAMHRALLDGCLAHQRADGLFHNVVDDPTSFVETNLGQMLAYSIYEGVRGGWLSDRYLTAADRARHAAWARVDAQGFVQGVAGAPTFSAPGVSPEGQAFFLMMEAAARKMGR